MAGEYVFELKGVTKQYDRTVVLDQVTLAFFFGAKIGVIGENGSGKSSLLRILSGADPDILGEARVAKQVRVGHLEQEPALDPERTVGEIVEDGVAGSRALLARYDEICGRLGAAPGEEADSLQAELGRLQDRIDAGDLWELDHQVELAMDALRCPAAERRAGDLSGGEKRRVALCRLLISNPDVLLLDEPTNHLDAESVEWMEAFLKRFPGTLVAVTHDRYFLNNVAEWILELDRGRAIPFQGNYESWLEKKRAAMDTSAKQAAARRKLLDRELEWVRMNASARHSRNLARIRRYEELAAEPVDTREETLEIRIPPGPRLGDLVVRAESLGMVIGDRQLFENVSFDLPRGGIVGVIGGNGAGKTTLLRLITGELQPASGVLRVGETVRLAVVDQSREDLRADRTVFEEISGGEETIDLAGRPMNARAYCARFRFRGADQQKKVGALSGGERNRVHLAKLLRGGANLILLDEPTNDLDVATLRSLEDGLESFGGCVVAVSHDRWFLDRVATHILAFREDGTADWFEGQYAEYRAHLRKQLGAVADRPKPIRFRPVRHD